MSLAVLHSCALSGMNAPEVVVEVHLANGLPSFTIVGLPEISFDFKLNHSEKEQEFIYQQCYQLMQKFSVV